MSGTLRIYGKPRKGSWCLTWPKDSHALTRPPERLNYTRIFSLKSLCYHCAPEFGSGPLGNWTVICSLGQCRPAHSPTQFLSKHSSRNFANASAEPELTKGNIYYVTTNASVGTKKSSENAIDEIYGGDFLATTKTRKEKQTHNLVMLTPFKALFMHAIYKATSAQFAQFKVKATTK